MSTYIEPARTVADAWLETLRNVRRAPSGRKVNVISTITEPKDEGSDAVRAAAEKFLASRECQQIEEVAETIFPISLLSDPRVRWHPGLDRAAEAEVLRSESQLYEMYLDMLEVILSANGNSRGTYFSRLITWPGNATGGVNQLGARIAQLRQRNTKGIGTFNAMDMDLGADSLSSSELEDLKGLQVYAALDRRTRGFPCLTHIDLTLLDGVVHMAAVYRHQYLVTKAYGNLLGLSRLLTFICDQSGHAVGELTVIATLADCEFKDFGQHRVDELIEESRAASVE